MFELLRRERLATLLGAKDWSAFADAYNGKGYRVNARDDKLREQYLKFAA
jgi:thiamine pyrophosphate-dependent acetolactate synthase large subunit-like protein